MGSNERIVAMARAADSASNLIDRRAVLRSGATANDIRAWLDAGILNPVARGLYHLATRPWTIETTMAIACHRAGPQGALSCQSALRTHGFDVRHGTVHAVTVRGGRPKRSGFVVHESLDLVPADVVHVGRLRVTTVERSLIDTARHLDGQELGNLVDFAIRTNRTTADDLAQRFLELGRRGRHGTNAMRACLADRTPLIGPDSNYFEHLFDRVVERGGFPDPLRQYRVDANGRTYFLDRAWPEHGLWVECDSMLAHASAVQLDNDLRRQNDIVIETGMMPLRFSYWQVVKTPENVIAHLASRLPRRTSSR